jgi:MFS family permease
MVVLWASLANSHMQALSSREFRGRVMSMYSILGLGTTVIGGPLSGWVSQQWSPRVAIALAGGATGVTALVLTLVARRRDAALDVHGGVLRV